MTAVVLILACSCNKDIDGQSSQVADTYTVAKVSGEADWDSIPYIPIDKVLWCEDTGIRAMGQLCYDEENLYVHLRAVEKNIRAEYTEPLSPVYEDSCLEFFFMLEDTPDYFNFEINPNGCLCAQFGPEKTDIIQFFYPDYQFKGQLRGNMYKCGNKTENKHYISWTRIDLDAPNFHCPEYFGALRFE